MLFVQARLMQFTLPGTKDQEHNAPTYVCERECEVASVHVANAIKSEESVPDALPSTSVSLAAGLSDCGLQLWCWPEVCFVNPSRHVWHALPAGLQVLYMCNLPALASWTSCAQSVVVVRCLLSRAPGLLDGALPLHFLRSCADLAFFAPPPRR